MTELTENPKVTAVIEFGTKDARKNPTPKAIKYFYRGIMLLSVIWSIFVEPIFTNIPVKDAYEINKILIALNALLYHISNLFGWVIEGNKKTEV